MLGNEVIKRSMLVFLLPLIMLIMFGCDGSGSSGGGGTCEIVANADASSFLEVDNTLNTGIEWFLGAYAFGAFLRPGECTQFGLLPDTTFDLVVTRCLSASDINCPTDGTQRTITFSVAVGETYAITVDENFF